MAAHGPMPKRPEERRRRNKSETPQSSVEMRGVVEIPPPNPRWHKLAIQLYESLTISGQTQFFEPSDWAEVQLLAESLSRDLKAQVVGIHPETGKPIMAQVPLKGASLAAYLKAFAGLGVSEGDRRRMGITIQRHADKPTLAPVTAIDDARDLLGG
jgi:hypothetical protein